MNHACESCNVTLGMHEDYSLPSASSGRERTFCRVCYRHELPDSLFPLKDTARQSLTNAIQRLSRTDPGETPAWEILTEPELDALAAICSLCDDTEYDDNTDAPEHRVWTTWDYAAQNTGLAESVIQTFITFVRKAGWENWVVTDCNKAGFHITETKAPFDNCVSAGPDTGGIAKGDINDIPF